MGLHTSKIRLGTAITQMSARTPAATAMAAMTMDHLSGGRFVLGLGVSGPQVVEGWYGQPFAKPLARTREYVAIVRDIVARQGRVTAAGPHYPLPLPDGTGLGKPLKSTMHPVRERIPIYLGAEGPKNVALAGEICDGWLSLFFSPGHQGFYRDALAEGMAREGARPYLTPSRCAPPCRSSCTTTWRRRPTGCARCTPSTSAGWARKARTSTTTSRRMGYEDEAGRIQDLYLDGKKDEAAAAVPTALIEELALIGPEDKIRHDLEAWRESIATTVLIRGGIDQVRQAAAELVLG